ncbi:MAG: myo-inositol-1-phosphate synthase, partial [Bradymonadia bacterium]
MDAKQTPPAAPAPAAPRLGILLQGMGAVASTFVAGVLAARKGLGTPVGSLTQMGHIRLGKRTDDNNPKINEFAPMTPLDGLVFGGWDIFGGDLYEAAETADVLDLRLLQKIEDELRAIKPMDGAFHPSYAKRLNGTHVKPGNRRDWANALRQDIRDFKATHGLERVVMVNCASTEVYIERGPTHQTMAAFEAAVDANDPSIGPSMLYAYAAIMEGVPYANGTPSLTADVPALDALAIERGVPIAGKDFKTGQ